MAPMTSQLVAMESVPPFVSDVRTTWERKDLIARCSCTQSKCDGARNVRRGSEGMKLRSSSAFKLISALVAQWRISPCSMKLTLRDLLAVLRSRHRTV